MQAVAFASPLLPGKEETDRQGIERLTSGEDREAYAAARRSQGITREAVWHQTTPNGVFAIVLIEADDLQRAFQAIATSDAPIDRQFREMVMDVHGFDLASDPPPDVRPISDVRF